MAWRAQLDLELGRLQGPWRGFGCRGRQWGLLRRDSRKNGGWGAQGGSTGIEVFTGSLRAKTWTWTWTKKPGHCIAIAVVAGLGPWATFNIDARGAWRGALLDAPPAPQAILSIVTGSTVQAIYIIKLLVQQ